MCPLLRKKTKQLPTTRMKTRVCHSRKYRAMTETDIPISKNVHYSFSCNIAMLTEKYKENLTVTFFSICLYLVFNFRPSFRAYENEMPLLRIFSKRSPKNRQV